MPKPTSSTRGKTPVSETVETFSFGSGRKFADNAEYASKGIRFDILAIAYETGKGYEGQNRWAITVKAADREAEVLSLGSNPGRDTELQAAQAHFDRGGFLKNKRLVRRGNAYYFSDGDS